MDFLQFNILNVIFKGMVIGIVASAPMGPVGILCVQRTINKGRWYGMATGVGASVSDIIYALITGLGMSLVLNFFRNESTKFYFQIIGGIILLLFGIYCFRSKPMESAQHLSHVRSKGTLLHNGVTAFLITFANPLIVFLFIALFAQFAFIMPGHPILMIIGYLSIIFGANLWWYGLTWMVDKIRNKFDEQGVRIINRFIGSIVIICSIITLIGTIFNLSFMNFLMDK
ncbi:LysE family translocator [Prevotella cerevisiae]|jgi:threonine/homoserine/homoserine lactone efflux protein|uniref:LysE family translocator n=1 Tax=Segatella cerevisiae TaxID=2053716 RepID=A0ABT1BZH9_9BACT|nr:LysE family transporter [Segatella cerevisiae]MCH3995375.1 LysE family translocator [Prevotella sp.]MCO6026484.1 LysE family translocator [Segatella cerevisiae]